MEYFHKITIGIAILCFVIVYSIFIIFYRYDSQIYPPSSNTCPDYWKVNNDGSCEIPANGMNTGHLVGDRICKVNPISSPPKYTNICDKGKKYIKGMLGYSTLEIPAGYNLETGPNRVYFNDDGWSKNGSKRCAHREWAKTNNIVWDGVSNYNYCGE